MPLPESGQPDEAYEAHLKKQDELDAEMEAIDVRLSRLRSERTIAEEAAYDARDAAELARDAVAAAERLRAAAAQAADRACGPVGRLPNRRSGSANERTARPGLPQPAQTWQPLRSGLPT